ncbi:MAG: tRNA 2-thiouridine(34) synthase MnmA [Coprothermobacterota bacterium]|nr:tRNA 2-thiouridine(34) synthase MnmA [Coprothermobacterota bacterium]
MVATSGGVDSAYAAFALVEDGYEVEGAFLHLCANSRCCTPAAEERARLLAVHLKIPFRRLDASETFREQVVESFLAEVRCGRTPNPCTLCNEQVKFGFLLEYARQEGFDALASGHYARLSPDAALGCGGPSGPKDSSRRLFRARDRSKDQSYVLYRLPRTVLDHLLFPLGDLCKAEVMARMERFFSAWGEVRESQDLCFLPPGMPLAAFLSELGVPIQPGPIVDGRGRFLGEHQGLLAYTVGQRRGIGLAGGPFYVRELRLPENTLVVGSRQEACARRLLAEQLNWLIEPPAGTLQGEVQIRSGHAAAPATAFLRGEDRLEINFAEAQFAVTPGQAAVLYQGEWLLGGGVIIEAE